MDTTNVSMNTPIPDHVTCKPCKDLRRSKRY